MHFSVSFRQVLRSEHCSRSVCSTAHATTRTFDNLCVVRAHLWGHFRALDQTCEDVFSCEDFYRVLGKSGRFSCKDFFRVLGKCMCLLSFCESSQQYKNLYVCVCVHLCVYEQLSRVVLCSRTVESHLDRKASILTISSMHTFIYDNIALYLHVNR